MTRSQTAGSSPSYTERHDPVNLSSVSKARGIFCQGDGSLLTYRCPEPPTPSSQQNTARTARLYSLKVSRHVVNLRVARTSYPCEQGYNLASTYHTVTDPSAANWVGPGEIVPDFLLACVQNMARCYPAVSASSGTSPCMRLPHRCIYIYIGTGSAHHCRGEVAEAGYAASDSSRSIKGSNAYLTAADAIAWTAMAMWSDAASQVHICSPEPRSTRNIM